MNHQSLSHRLTRLESIRLRPVEQNPYRIPGWMRPWFDAHSIEDMELLEAGGFPKGSDGDPALLPPDQRDRFDDLATSWDRFCAEHAP